MCCNITCSTVPNEYETISKIRRKDCYSIATHRMSNTIVNVRR